MSLSHTSAQWRRARVTATFMRRLSARKPTFCAGLLRTYMYVWGAHGASSPSLMGRGCRAIGTAGVASNHFASHIPTMLMMIASFSRPWNPSTVLISN